MKILLLTLSILIISNQNLHAAPTIITTPAETYILSRKDSSILHINHITKKHTVLRHLGQQLKAGVIGILQYNNLLYVTFGVGEVGIFNFHSKDHIGGNYLKLPHHNALPMHIHEGYGYVAHRTDKKISVIDLRNFTVSKVIDLPYAPHFMTIYKNHAYLLCNRVSEPHLVEVDLLNNDALRKVELSITESKDIKFDDKLAYIVDHMYHTINIIDLSTMADFGRLTTSSSLNNILGKFEAECDYPTNKISAKRTMTSGGLCNLNNKISFYRDPPKYYDERYIKVEGIWPKKITLLDPPTGFVLKTLTTYHDDEIFQVNDDFYHGVDLIFTRKDLLFILYNLSPFDFPFMNDDREAAFEIFERALSSYDNELMRRAFIHALNLGHPKAYAIAAYGHFMACWGAPEDFGLFKGYLTYADRDYFLLLLHFSGDFATMNQHQKRQVMDVKNMSWFATIKKLITGLE